jgi:hypothetical protein
MTHANFIRSGYLPTYLAGKTFCSHMLVLIPLRWWYSPSQYTVWCSLLVKWSTRFRFYLLCGLYVRCVGHMTHANLMRPGYLSIYLVGKTFCSHTEVTLKMIKSSRLYFWSSVLWFTLSTHSLVFRSMIFVSINLMRVWHGLIFVIASTELLSNFRNLSTLVRLTKTHQVDHQSLF